MLRCLSSVPAILAISCSYLNVRFLMWYVLRSSTNTVYTFSHRGVSLDCKFQILGTTQHLRSPTRPWSLKNRCFKRQFHSRHSKNQLAMPSDSRPNVRADGCLKMSQFCSLHPRTDWKPIGEGHRVPSFCWRSSSESVICLSSGS